MIIETLEMIRPPEAMRLLARNTDNRRLHNRLFWSAAAALTGDWNPTRSLIIVSEDGQLLDGQHRLHVAALGYLTFTTRILQGVTPEDPRPSPPQLRLPPPHNPESIINAESMDTEQTMDHTPTTTSWNKTRPPLPVATRRRILRRDRYTCRGCGGQRCGNEQLEVDHIINVAEGGDDSDENLQTLGARPCHAEKTRQEIARGRARRSTNRPKRPHPGLR